MGWKWGCQPFSCPCSQNVTHCRKEICSTCLFKTSILARSVLEFQASTPYQKQVPESDSTLHQFCMMVASCPSLRCSFRKKHLSHVEKQSVWSRSCGLEDLLQYCDICDCALSCAMRLLQTNEHLSRLSF